MKTSEVLERALALIPDEQHWGKEGSLTLTRHCIASAIGTSARKNPNWVDDYRDAKRVVQHCIAPLQHFSLAGWNDDPTTTYADVRRVLEQAIAHAQAEEASRG